jgi:hypothetical protein
MKDVNDYLGREARNNERDSDRLHQTFDVRK